jgi:hypothetical protein
MIYGEFKSPSSNLDINNIKQEYSNLTVDFYVVPVLKECDYSNGSKRLHVLNDFYE